MIFYQSAEFEGDLGRYRVTRGYTTLDLLMKDSLAPGPGEEWSDYETWEGSPAEWPGIQTFSESCCWCATTAMWLLSYTDENGKGDPMCSEHMRQHQVEYDRVYRWY